MTPAIDQTVLFLGDSITHAHRRPDEVHDCYQLGCGYVNSVASELASARPQTGLRFVNLGECGFTVKNVLERWRQSRGTVDATVVSILIGVNDTQSPGHDPGDFRRDYQQLIDDVRRRLPGARMLLLEPFGVQVEQVAGIDVITRRQLDRLPAVQSVVRELAVAHDLRFVPLQHLFDRTPPRAWTLDGIHPTAAGHWQIARAWTASVRDAGWFPEISRQGDDT